MCIRVMRKFILPLIFLSICFNTAFSSASSSVNEILIVNVNGEITAATETMIGDALKFASARNMRLVIVELDTPGGEVESVKGIMSLIDNSEVPVCIFVYPAGATAWSGGTYILMASHIAAMAPGTTIGSCQPVLSIGWPVESSKYVNALSSLMVNHAKLHDRNETAAEHFVTENLNLGPEESLKYHVVEFVASGLHSLLEKLESYALVQSRGEVGEVAWKVVPAGEARNYTLKETFDNISNASLIEYTPGIRVFFLSILFNPVVSSLLLILGIFLFFIGIKTPGYGAEIAGAICLFLALIAFGSIGIAPAAILFIVLGVALIIAELKTHIGVLAVSGAVCIILASLLLFPSPQWLIFHEVSEMIRELLVGMATFLSAIFGFIVYKVAEAKRRKVKTGSEVLIGARGVAVKNVEPVGVVRVLGEFWQARTSGERILKGEEVIVVDRKGLVLIVRKAEEKA